jgi:hypothetical protein
MKKLTTLNVLSIFLKDMAIISGFVIVLEIILRIFIPQPLQHMLRYVYESADKYGGYQFKKSVKTICNNGFGDHIFAINSWRCRDKEYHPKMPGEFRILCVGDSFSENQALDVEQIYPKILERLLQKTSPSKPFSVINAGMAGWNLWCMYDFLQTMLPSIQPDLVIIAIQGSFKSLFSAERPEVEPKIIFAGLPMKADATFMQRLQWLVWFANQQLECISHFYSAFRKISYYPFIYMGIGREVRLHPMVFNQNYYDSVFEPTLKVVKKIKLLCLTYGCPLAILNVPSDYECSPKDLWLRIQFDTPNVARLDISRPVKLVEGIGKKLFIPVFDPTHDLRQSKDSTYFPEFRHWNEHGNRIVAEGLLHFLQKENLLQPIKQ